MAVGLELETVGMYGLIARFLISLSFSLCCPSYDDKFLLAFK
jgi:hypothetical protein